VTEVSDAAPASSRPPINWRRVAPYLFIAPNMLVFGLFTIWPALNGFNISFYDSDNGRTFSFVGIDNYLDIVSDDEFWEVARNTLVFVVAFVAATTVSAMALALLLNAQIRARGFLRAAYFLPVLISPIVVGLIWNWALERRLGLVNSVLDSVGLGQPGWLLDPKLALLSTVLVGLWTHMGFFALILLAGLQGIDPHLYEAARIDGASAWQQVRQVTLPLLKPTTFVVLILATITGFQAFDFIYLLTGGGPVGATTLIVQFIYEQAFRSPIQYGLASAASVLLNYLLGRRQEAT
jgi:ABC-type sugar transport system permease subunit